MNINIIMCESLIETHINIIKKNPIFKTIIDKIIDDMLMNKVSYNEESKKIILHINNSIMTLILDWYKMTNLLPSFELIVYRGVRNMCSTNNIILQPIPFSTSIEENNAYDWINKEDISTSFIMKINVSNKTKFSVTGNMGEGNEVILPAGCLHFVEKNFKNNIKFNTYNFIPFSKKEMIDHFKNVIFI